MRVQSCQKEDVTIVTIHGRLTSATALSTLAGKVAAVGAQPVKLLLNLKPVRGIDSAGFGVIREAARAVERTGGRMALLGARRIGNLMATIKLMLILACYEREDEAIASFQ